MMKYLFFLLLGAAFCYGDMPKGKFKDYTNYYFVETGTFGGQGLKNAMQGTPFKKYHSIEIHEGDYAFAKMELQAFPQIHLHLGDSSKILSSIIEKMHKPITFWLDAHVFPPQMEGQNCPLMEELEAIKQHPIKTHTILIDDINCCGTLAFDYITLEQIMAKILEINPRYTFTLIAGGDDGSVPKNILVSRIEE